MVLTPFQGRVALPSALHFQLPSGCQECDAAVSHPADSPPVSLLTPDFPRTKLAIRGADVAGDRIGATEAIFTGTGVR